MKEKYKRILGWVLGLAVFGGGFLAWENSPPVQRQQLAETLVGTIAQDWTNEGEGETFLRLQDITPFAWERVYMFAPYTAAGRIEETLGFAWPQAKSIGIDYRDDITLLVFVNGGKVVRYLAFPRVSGDFSAVTRSKGFTPKEAVFVVRKEGVGQLRLILHRYGE